MQEELTRYFTGQMSAEERLELLRRVKADKALKKEFAAFQNLYALTHTAPRSGDSRIGQMAWRRFDRERRRGVLRRITWQTLAYAASIALIVTATWMVSRLNTAPEPALTRCQVHAPAGQRSCVKLSDGTMVWLNALSTLSYPSRFGYSERRVQLTGEAWFEVAHDAEHPFVVEAAGYDVKALGTTFDVEAYEGHTFSASLIEGSVVVSNIDNPAQSLQLTPNNVATVSDGQLVAKPVADPGQFLWRRGLISIRQESLEELMRRFEKCYDIRIVVVNEAVRKAVYTGKFRYTDGIDHALRVLQRDLPFHYTRDDENHTIYIK